MWWCIYCAKDINLCIMVLQSKTHIPRWQLVSKSIAVVVRNMTATPILFKKNAPVDRVVAANAVPNALIQPGMVDQLGTSQGIQMGRPKMTVEQQREVLFKQLDLSSLDSWTPKSRAATHMLLAGYHNIFSLDSCELGCLDLAWHVI